MHLALIAGVPGGVPLCPVASPALDKVAAAAAPFWLSSIDLSSHRHLGIWLGGHQAKASGVILASSLVMKT